MTKMAIHQLATNLSFGDAISNDMLQIQVVLRDLGYDSKIYAQYVDPRMANHFNLFTEYHGNPENLIIFHASIGCDLFDFVKKLPDRKMMIYHNMTPSRYFKGYNDHLVNILKQGRRQLSEASSYVDLAVGVSSFNTAELVELGYENTDTLPIFVDFAKYDLGFNKTLFNKLEKGDVTNILFVGRFSPNKRHDDVVKSFYMYNKYFNSNSKLILIGSSSGMENYYKRIMALAKKLGIENKLLLPGHISFEDMVTYYKSADLFLSMSEHEGFFVPILECFYLGVPVIAYGAAAIPETMGKGGVLLDNKKYDYVAEKMNELIANDDFRKEVVARQYERLKDFDINKVKEKFKQILKLIK